MADESEIKIDELYEHVNKKKVFILLISLDFTYLNKKFGYDATNALKAEILSSLRLEKFIFFKDLGSKLLFLFESLITSRLKENINNRIITPFLQKREMNPKMIESRLILFTTSEFGDFDLSFENRFGLFEEACEVEKYLKDLRGKIKVALRAGDLGIVQKFQDACAKLSRMHPTRSLDYGNVKRVMKDIRNSLFLTKAAGALFSGSKDLNVFYSNVVNYFFWLKLQEVLLEDFKKEKIYRFFDPTKFESRPPKPVVKFDDLQVWYNSSIALFYPFLSSEEKKKAEEIEAFVNNPFRTRKETEDMVKKIYAFTKGLNVKGHLNLPVANLEVSDESHQFQKRQFFVAFGKDASTQKLEEWKNSGFAKRKFPLVCDTPVQKFFDGFAFMNAHRFASVRAGERMLLSVAFLEIDGFNAFNKYFFPTDSDKVYAQMINRIFEVANREILRAPDVFASMTVYILGDEFFFAFLHANRNEAEIIEKYLRQWRDEALRLVLDVHFVKTEKKTVKIEGNDVVVRHAVSVEGKSFFRKNEVDMELARLSFSGYSLLNRPVIKADYLLQLGDSLLKVEAGVTAIKTGGKGLLEFKRAS